MGVKCRPLGIEPVFKSFLATLKEPFNGLKTEVTEENIQARCRGILVMAMANKYHKMVLTTGNKSEMSMGYCTLYGDMSGGFAPLKDVSKLRVFALSKYRNTVSPVIPQRVITRPPSAELAPNQKDEDSLPPYEILDEILYQFIEKDQSREQIIKQGFDADVVNKVIRLTLLNEYKRRQSAPGPKITGKAFGRERRFPITSGYTSG
jgi:NAD+ synthase (glutamine-hydrolysing)